MHAHIRRERVFFLMIRLLEQQTPPLFNFFICGTVWEGAGWFIGHCICLPLCFCPDMQCDTVSLKKSPSLSLCKQSWNLTCFFTSFKFPRNKHLFTFTFKESPSNYLLLHDQMCIIWPRDTLLTSPTQACPTMFWLCLLRFPFSVSSSQFLPLSSV